MLRSTLFLTLLLLSCGKTEAPKAKRERRSVSVHPPKEYRKEVDAFFERVGRGALEEAALLFHKGMKEKLPPPKWKKLWEVVQKSAGAYKGVLSVHKKRRGRFVVYTVRCSFVKRSWEFVLTFNNKGKIIDLVNRPGSQE